VNCKSTITLPRHPVTGVASSAPSRLVAKYAVRRWRSRSTERQVLLGDTPVGTGPGSRPALAQKYVADKSVLVVLDRPRPAPCGVEPTYFQAKIAHISPSATARR